jgi:diacylglycerol kinase (ATP)
MRACVIFNPTACGERARRFKEALKGLAPPCELCPTTGPGAARDLARHAVERGHDVVIAAGGDGTVFEVLNGIADAPDGLARCALGVLPLGTANVLAHELRMPSSPVVAWEALMRGKFRQIDCGRAEFRDDGGRPQEAHFAVVAGAGLDARAVQLVDLRLKRRAGKLAYIAAALRAFIIFPDRVRCPLRGAAFEGRAILAGNGRFYAGDIPVFEDGALDSGRLHVRGVSSVTPGVLARCLVAYLTGRWTLGKRLRADAVEEIRLESEKPVPIHLDGEFAGWLPARFRILPRALRVLAPA